MKGKSQARYEFGNKVGVLMGSKRMVITAVKVFEGNPNDGKTIAPLLEQCKKFDHRMAMAVNYFKTFMSANMNALLACTAWNLLKYVAHTPKMA